MSGPYGRFVLKTSDDEHAILVGGGTGVVPLKSMVRHAFEAGEYEGEATLDAGGCTRAHLYDVDVFRQLDDDHDAFTYRP